MKMRGGREENEERRLAYWKRNVGKRRKWKKRKNVKKGKESRGN